MESNLELFKTADGKDVSLSRYIACGAMVGLGEAAFRYLAPDGIDCGSCAVRLGFRHV